MTANRIRILERHGFSWFKPTKNRALPVPAIPVATKRTNHNALLPVVASHRGTTENVPTTIIPVRNFQIDDAQAIFDSLRGGEPHPSRLNFKIVLVGSDGLRLSPPTYAFEGRFFLCFYYFSMFYLFAVAFTLTRLVTETYVFSQFFLSSIRSFVTISNRLYDL